ncbi:MAG: hypothetical protein IT233_09650 [Bacteroidia bacterium]|nr:hypothetical protein [Bacteroidia bacterium]
MFGRSHCYGLVMVLFFYTAGIYAQHPNAFVYRILADYSWAPSTLSVFQSAHRISEVFPSAGFFSLYEDPVQQHYPHPQPFGSFLNTRLPYTWLHARFGMGNEQLFDGLHSQNITPRDNFSVAVLRNNGEGMYLRQQFFSERYALTFNHRPLHGKYAIALAIQLISREQNENGGLEDVSLFTDNVYSNRKLLPVILENASSQSRSRSIYVHQYLFFSKDTLWENKRRGAHFRMSWYGSDELRVYSDNTPGEYYPAIFLDSTQTRDSVCFSRLGADVLLNIPVRRWNMEAGFGGCISDYYNAGFDSVMNDISFKGRIFQDTLVELKGEYVLKGPSTGNSQAILAVKDVLRFAGFDSTSVVVGLTIQSSSIRSPLFFSHYVSNHYSWANNLSVEFSRYVLNSAELVTSLRKFGAELLAGYRSMEGFAFVNANGMPQWANRITWADIQLRLLRKAGAWTFRAEACYRISEDTLLPVPALKGKFDIFWEKKFNSEKLALQLGASGTYFGSYRPGNYLPALGMFSPGGNFNAGDYIYPALYVHLLVGPARIFVRADHVTSGLFGYNYFIAEKYPGPDRIIRVGVKWDFFD